MKEGKAYKAAPVPTLIANFVSSLRNTLTDFQIWYPSLTFADGLPSLEASPWGVGRIYTG